jgi:hypothetical protein
LEDGGGGKIGGGGSGRKVISNYQIYNMHESFRGEGFTYTNWQQFGAHKNSASRECPNIRVPMFGDQTGQNKVLSVLQIDLSACADRKIVFCMCICKISQRNHNFTE